MKKMLLIFLLFVSQSILAAERTATLELLGMYCPMCPVTIRTALDMSDGVVEVSVTRKPGRAVVKYDDTQTSPAKLVQVVKDAGYNANIITSQ